MRHFAIPDGTDDPGPSCPHMVSVAEANPFYEASMLGAALAAFDTERRIVVLEAHDGDGRTTARLPVERLTRHGRLPARHCATWIYPHCYYAAPILDVGAEQAGWRELLARLDAAPWSGDFLHLRLIDPDGPAIAALRAICARTGRDLREIARHERAMLRSPLAAADYRDATIRAKKRKELRRQRSRLSETGEIVHRALAPDDDVAAWCDDFLVLERSGWKGAGGTALGSSDAGEAFFRAGIAAAHRAGTLDMLRIDCDGRAIAMLVNLVGARGGFSFKIAIDPAFARYSPGVLVELDNLVRVLDDRRTPWMDSCAAPGHPMIDSLWGERRVMAQYRVALDKGPMAALRRSALTAAESAAHRLKRRLFR